MPIRTSRMRFRVARRVFRNQNHYSYVVILKLKCVDFCIRARVVVQSFNPRTSHPRRNENT